MLTVTYAVAYAECRYAECRYAECCYAECRGALFVLPDSARSKKLGGHQSRQKPFAQNALTGFGAKIQT